MLVFCHQDPHDGIVSTQDEFIVTAAFFKVLFRLGCSNAGYSFHAFAAAVTRVFANSPLALWICAAKQRRELRLLSVFGEDGMIRRIFEWAGAPIVACGLISIQLCCFGQFESSAVLGVVQDAS